MNLNLTKTANKCEVLHSITVFFNGNYAMIKRRIKRKSTSSKLESSESSQRRGDNIQSSVKTRR